MCTNMLEFGLEEVSKGLAEVGGRLLVVDTSDSFLFKHNFEEDEGVTKGGEVVDVVEHLEEEEEDELAPRVPVIVVRQRCVEENVVEMALNKDERESVIRRSPKEGVRRAQRILDVRILPDPAEQRILLDPTEDLLTVDHTELKPSHHSTPLLPSNLGLNLGLLLIKEKKRLKNGYLNVKYQGLLRFPSAKLPFQGNVSSFLRVLKQNVKRKWIAGLREK